MHDYERAKLLGTVNRFECFAAKRGNKVAGPKYRARNDNSPLQKVAVQLPMKGLLSVLPSSDYHFQKHAEMPHLYF